MDETTNEPGGVIPGAAQPSDAERWELIGKQLDHMDEMLHEIHRFVTDNAPYLERAKTLMDPGRAVRGFLPGARKRAAEAGAEGQ